MKKVPLSFCLLIFLLYGGGAALAQGEKLIPAAMGIRGDKKGNSWNVEENGALGRIGTSMINSGLVLSVNGQKFFTKQPLMTGDGREFIMQGGENTSLPGLRITRRIRVMEEEGGLRYLEILTNTSANPFILNVTLSTNFSGNYKTFVTDRGNSEAIILNENEGGILVTPASTQSNKAFLFALCAAGSDNKPTISARNRYALSFQYRLSIAPGQTRVLAHSVAQVVVPPQFNRRNLMKTFRPFSINKIAGEIPKKYRSFLANGKDSTSLSYSDLMANTSLKSLGVARGPNDVLAMGEKTRLIGMAKCSDFRMNTAYGEIVLPFENVAAVVGLNKGLRETVRVFLRDGQVFSGKAEVDEFSFSLANGGRMNLSLNSLDRLVRAKHKGENIWDKTVVAMIETFDGDRLRINKEEDIKLTGVTPWGELVFSIPDLIWMGPYEGEPVGHFVELKNGNSCLVFPSGKPLKLHSEIFGEHDLDLHRIRSIITKSASDRTKYGGISGLATFIQLPGNQQIVGTLEDSHIKLISNGDVINLAPGEIRKLLRSDGKSSGNSVSKPGFRIELWDGGFVDGFFQSESLSVKVGERNWRIPLSDIEELETPTPSLGDGALKKIKTLLTSLAADAWVDREKATNELGAFGYLARPVLQQEANKNPDPEVRRRIERILSETEK